MQRCEQLHARARARQPQRRTRDTISGIIAPRVHVREKGREEAGTARQGACTCAALSRRTIGSVNLDKSFWS